jgi:DNA gyrase subunit A
VIENFVDFRREVIRRRIEFELRKAEARAHILEGLRIALDHLDAVIKLIRGSKNPPEAKGGLTTQFGLTDIQAQAILDMQLQRLTGLERQKILDELAELQALIANLRGILADQKKILQIIVDELKAVKEKFADPRRTQLIDEEGDFSIEDLITEEDVAVTVTDTGYIKRTPITTYRTQNRGGKGRIGMRTREEDVVNHLFVASTHSYMMIFSDRGRAYWLKVHEIPDVGADGKGKSIANLVQFEQGEKLAAMLAVQEFAETRFVVMGTRKGTIKKTELSAFANPRAGGIIAMGIEEGDAVIDVQLSDGQSEIFIGTRDGKAIRFEEGEVRAMGRTAYGVRGIQLREGDEVVAMQVAKPGGTLLTVTEKGYAKNTLLDEYRVTGRGGLGVKNVEVTDKNGPVVAIAQIHATEELLVMTEWGKILRTPANEIRTIGRATQGVRLMELEGEDKIVSVALVEAAIEDTPATPETPAPTDETPQS